MLANQLPTAGNQRGHTHVLLVVWVLSLAACQPSAGGLPSPTAEPSPTPQAVTASPTPIAPATTPPSVLSKATTYSPHTFEIPLAISFGSEWHVSDDLRDELLVVGGTGAYEGVELEFMSVNNAQVGDPDSTGTLPWPGDFLAYLRSNSHLQVGDPVAVTVDGVSGVQVDVVIVAGGGRRTLIKLQNHDWFYLDYDQDWRFVILDEIRGKRLVIGTTEAPEAFAAATELAQPIISSLKFTD